MKTQLRPLVAAALYLTKAHTLPSVCERYGMEPGSGDEAFSSKTRYVMRRLERLSDAQVLAVAKQVVEDFPDDKLQVAIETLNRDACLVSDITRHNLAEALNGHPLGGKRDILDLLREHFPDIDKRGSYRGFDDTLADDIYRHSVLNEDWDSAEILGQVGFLTCSQARLFRFLEDILHPVRRVQEEQDRLVPLHRDYDSLIGVG